LSKQFDYLIFIGRFQPFHKGHLHVVNEALKLSENVILVIGSHEKARSVRNPFTTAERAEIIFKCFPDLLTYERHSGERRLHLAPQHDHTYNDDRWIASIQASVNSIVHARFKPGPIKIGIVGYDKDHSTYYLKKFPQWELVEIAPVENYSGTRFREQMFALGLQDCSDHVFINEEHKAIINRIYDRELQGVLNDYDFVVKYKDAWAHAPFPPTFATVDAVVTQGGHILLIERGEPPGVGLWALPGGFVQQDETLETAVLRELYEETRLDIPRAVLKGCIEKSRTFDDPHRSDRGRTITEAYLLKLHEKEMPVVKGSDDAKKAFWVPFADVVLNRDKFYEDHYHIIESMVGL
jgi:bifunctional NMN adenylyltransferase/nudix hydrolase